MLNEVKSASGGKKESIKVTIWFLIASLLFGFALGDLRYSKPIQKAQARPTKWEDIDPYQKPITLTPIRFYRFVTLWLEYSTGKNGAHLSKKKQIEIKQKLAGDGYFGMKTREARQDYLHKIWLDNLNRIQKGQPAFQALHFHMYNFEARTNITLFEAIPNKINSKFWGYFWDLITETEYLKGDHYITTHAFVWKNVIDLDHMLHEIIPRNKIAKSTLREIYNMERMKSFKEMGWATDAEIMSNRDWDDEEKIALWYPIRREIVIRQYLRDHPYSDPDDAWRYAEEMVKAKEPILADLILILGPLAVQRGALGFSKTLGKFFKPATFKLGGEDVYITDDLIRFAAADSSLSKKEIFNGLRNIEKGDQILRSAFGDILDPSRIRNVRIKFVSDMSKFSKDNPDAFGMADRTNNILFLSDKAAKDISVAVHETWHFYEGYKYWSNVSTYFSESATDASVHYSLRQWFGKRISSLSGYPSRAAFDEIDLFLRQKGTKDFYQQLAKIATDPGKPYTALDEIIGRTDFTSRLDSSMQYLGGLHRKIRTATINGDTALAQEFASQYWTANNQLPLWIQKELLPW